MFIYIVLFFIFIGFIPCPFLDTTKVEEIIEEIIKLLITQTPDTYHKNFMTLVISILIL